MNGYEFVLTLVGMLIVGIWGLLFIGGKYGLYDTTDDKKKKLTKKDKINHRDYLKNKGEK